MMPCAALEFAFARCLRQCRHRHCEKPEPDQAKLWVTLCLLLL